MLLASALSWLLHPDLKPLLEHGTPVFLAVVFVVVFAESGLLVGFFLPGDSLLFAAGLVAGLEHRPNILILVVVAFVGAVLGDQVGYMFGQRTGPRLFQREDSRLFKQSNVRKAHDFFDRHGPKAIVLARGRQIVGVGAGQMSRLDSVRIAVEKAGDRAKGAVLASDAFFPFRDGPDTASAAGVTALIQPGGSRRDAETFRACDEHGLAMLLTGRRHFRH